MPRRRRLTAVAGATTLTAATLLVGAPHASAATQSITAANFEWALGEIFQYTVPGLQQAQTPDIPRCLLLSAGSIETSGASLVSSSYSAGAGDVQILKNGVAPTFETRCAGAVAAGPTATPINQKVVWSGGTGTRNVETGASTISFTGMMSIKVSGSPIRIENPVLTVNADGTGALTATLKIGPTLATSVATPNVNVAEFEGLAVTSTSGFTKRPNYAGKTADVPQQNGTVLPNLPAQAVRDAYAAAFPIADDPLNLEKQAGAWPQSWITAIAADAGRFHSNSLTSPPTASDQARRTSPMAVNYGTVGPVTNSQNLNVSVPGVVCAGEVVWTIDEDGNVALAPGTTTGPTLTFAGDLDEIEIDDTRVGNGLNCYPAFEIVGQAANFTTTGGGTVPGSYLGWDPNVVGASLEAGEVVLSGYQPTGPGLSVSSRLVRTIGTAPGSGSAGAELTLALPSTTPAGAYTTTLTLTGLG